MKTCPFCNAQTLENSRFCIHCMTSFEEKKVVNTIKPTLKWWHILTACFLVFAIVVVLISKNKEPVPHRPSSAPSNAISPQQTSSLPDDLVLTNSILSKTSSTSSQNFSEESYSDISDFSPSASSKKTTSSETTSDKKSSSITATSQKETTSKTPSSVSASSPVSALNHVSSNTSGTNQAKTLREEDCTFRVSGAEVIITKVNADISGDIIVPDVLNGYPITVIDNNAFENCTEITSVKLPDSVTEIKDATFRNCTSLKNVTLPNTITYIGNSAFYLCESLETVNLPVSLKLIGNSAFRDCISLKNVTLPNTITEINANAFSGCSTLSEIEIPDSVTILSSDAFLSCTALKKVIIGSGLKGFNGFRQCSALETVVIKEGPSMIIASAFENCNKIKNIYLPKSVTSIGKNSFNFTNITVNIYYAGSESDREKIIVSTGNTAFSNAQWHYNSNY